MKWNEMKWNEMKWNKIGGKIGEMISMFINRGEELVFWVAVRIEPLHCPIMWLFATTFIRNVAGVSKAWARSNHNVHAHTAGQWTIEIAIHEACAHRRALTSLVPHLHFSKTEMKFNPINNKPILLLDYVKQKWDAEVVEVNRKVIN